MDGRIEGDSGCASVEASIDARACPALALAPTRALVSSLAQHTAALKENPACSLLVGEPEDRGDPLVHPRLTLQCTAAFVPRPGDLHDRLRATYLRQVPKAKLYIDFGDFTLVRLDMTEGFLNGGFGKAFHLTRSLTTP